MRVLKSLQVYDYFIYEWVQDVLPSVKICYSLVEDIHDQRQVLLKAGKKDMTIYLIRILTF